MDKLSNKIRKMRQTGLAQHGEFGPENLAFKILRSQGDIEKLYDAKIRARSQELSLKELKKQPISYGYGRDHLEEVGLTPDGTNPSTCEFANEDQTSKKTDREIIEDFVEFCIKELDLSRKVKLRLRRDPEWSRRNKTFGRYNEATQELEVAVGQRHIMDVLRTLGHELVHQKQNEIGVVPPDAGSDGSAWENEANAEAGVLMRKYGKKHPDLFEDAIKLSEASGYIPTAAEANDPRYKMALTVDVRPGAIGRAANALMLDTDAQGHPQMLRPDGIVKRLSEEFKRFRG